MGGLGYLAYSKIKALSTTEAGYLDGVTAGTATASKAVVLNASGSVAGLNEVTAVKHNLTTKATAQATITGGTSTAAMATAINACVNALTVAGIMATS
jgi:hypothetical protein